MKDDSIKKRAPSLYDVASRAGVSHQTVSQVVKGGPHVSQKTRDRVERAIAELQYKPNLAARALARSKSERIGALYFDQYDEVGPTRTMQAAIDHAREAEFLVDVVRLHSHDAGEVNAALELLLRADVEGIVVFSPLADIVRSVKAKNVRVPIVFQWDDHEPHAEITGTSKAVDYLIGLGHTKFFYLSGPLSWIPARNRRIEFNSAIRNRGLEAALEVEGDWTPSSGYAAATAMSLDQGISAFVASNDQMALGALRGLKQRGIRVPDDISVVGFDNIQESAYFEPTLTTITNDFVGHGRIAMDQLLRAIDGKPREARSLLEPRLVIRESTASVNRSWE